MSDWYDTATFHEFSTEDVHQALDRAESALREAGLIEGEHDPEASLGGSKRVVRPARNVKKLCSAMSTVTSLRTNGVVFSGPWYFDSWSMVGFKCFACPSCQVQTASSDAGIDDLVNALGTQAFALSKGKPTEPVRCPKCGKSSDVRHWKQDDTFLVADAAITFWNWPYLDKGTGKEDQSPWAIDVRALVETAMGRPALWRHLRI